MRFSSVAASLALGISIAALAPTAGYVGPAGYPVLLTADQAQIDRAAIALLEDPQIKAARDKVIRDWSALPPHASDDGKGQLAGAVDELVYFSVRSAVEASRPTPAIVWAISPPHRLGALEVPGSRWGIDLPDRIYRGAAIDASGRYVIRGKRSASPSNDDFLFETTDRTLKTTADLPASRIDVAADGSFAITVDASPADGRRNHLTLPPGATGLLIRDTLADWSAQLPNTLSIERIGGAAAPAATPGQTRAAALALLDGYAKFDAGLLGNIYAKPANQVTPVVRGLSSGVAGAIVGTSRFSVQDDEALVFTIDLQGAGYANFQLTDPWARSLPQAEITSSLSDRQARPNADGTITFILAPRDPGYYNWLNTNGLHDGLVALRVEKVANPDPATIVRTARLVKLSELAAALPEGAARVTPAERARQIADRKAGFARRLQ